MGGMMAAFSEGLQLGKQSGLDMDKIVEVRLWKDLHFYHSPSKGHSTVIDYGSMLKWLQIRHSGMLCWKQQEESSTKELRCFGALVMMQVISLGAIASPMFALKGPNMTQVRARQLQLIASPLLQEVT
jgi:hypothetical protein